MSKRDEFKALMEINKKATPNITNEACQGFLNLARTAYGLTTQEAEKILKDVGITVGPSINYFEALKLNTNEIKNLSDTHAEKRIQKAYDERSAELKRMPNSNPRKAERQNLLAKAKVFLIDKGKWKQHLQEIAGKKPADDNGNGKTDSSQGTRSIIKFRNGNEATNIPQLATLLEKNAKEATDMLYGGYLKRALEEAKEFSFALMVPQVINAFPRGNPAMGLMIMVALLRGKVKMRRGGEAGTPQELSRLIDQNWDEAKTLLYNGFFQFWFEYSTEKKFASIADKITTTFPNDEDIGLEEFVQRLDPNIGDPEPKLNHATIDFGDINAKSQKSIRLEIKNRGRGFLTGDVQITSNIPGLQISDVEIYGSGAVTVRLDAKSLKAKQKYQASLVVDTNGGKLNVPISCYVDNQAQESVQRVAISGLSVAAITLVARLIVQQFGTSGWLETQLTGTGFINWEQHWQWVEWFQWPWFEWTVYTLGAPGAGLGFVIAFASLGIGIFAYCYFFLRKKRVR